ncbi:hypothetical protein NQZ79_g7955 [Umbelopsis isabellina]|nr:hypothetical protein NQZ79_g7955 [Umbelopsis isabellina]
MSVHHSSSRLQRAQIPLTSHGSRTSLSIDTRPKNVENAASLGSFRKLSPGRKLKMAIQSGTKAFSAKSDSMIYAAGMSPEHAYNRSLRHHRPTWHHHRKHKASINSLTIKEKTTFAFKEKTFVCMQIPNLDEPNRIVFLRIGHTGQLLMVPYPLELSEEAYKTDPIYSFYNSEGDNHETLSQKLQRVRKVLGGLDKMGSSVWSPIGILVNEASPMAHSRIQTEHEGRTYNFQLRNMEDKTELYNRVRFEMQLSQRHELLEPPCQEDDSVHLDILINDAQAQIQAQKAILEAIEQRLGADMHDVSKYTKELELLDSSLPSLEEKIDRANYLISSKDRLESCRSECHSLFRQLTAITQAINRREQKMSRYGSWLTTMQVRVGVIKMATRNADIWKQFRTWIASGVSRQNSFARQTKAAVMSNNQERHQTDRQKTRPQSAIITSPGNEPLPRAKIYDNSKRNSIAVSSPRRISNSFSQDLKNNLSGNEENRNTNSPGGLERRAQTVSARLSYLAQPKRVNEPVKTSRSDTMPTTFPIAPRTTPLVKPAQTALVKARSVRARTKADEKPTAKAVVAPTPAYVQNAKSKIDWEAIKRERRATQIESTSFEFVSFDENDREKKEEHKETLVEDGEAVP